MMAEFTKTPWCVPNESPIVVCAGDNSAQPGKRLFVLRGPLGTSESYPFEIMADYTALIVKAVNSHDALVEALEGLVEAVRRDCDVRDKGISGYTGARLTDAKNTLASIKERA